MKQLLLVTAMLLCGLGLYAQDNSTYDLQKCISYGIENHESVKNAMLEAEKAAASVKETTSIGLPQINGKVDFIDNLHIQNQFLPANIFDPSAPEGLIVPVEFGLKYSMNAQVTLTQLIFDGSYFVGLRAAKAYKGLMEKSISQSKIELVQKITQAYYTVLVSKEQINALEQNKSTLDSLLSDTRVLFDNGFVEKIDVLRLEVNLTNLKVEVDKASRSLEIALDLLKYQMGMPISENVTVAEKLEDFKSELTPETSQSNPENRIEYQLLQERLALMQLDEKNEKVKLLPSMAAFANLGYNTGQQEFGETFKTGNYRRYSMIGVSLDVPIFSSFRRKHRIAQANINVQETELQITSLSRTIDFQAKQASSDLQNALDNLKSLEKNIELAQEVYDIAQIKYKTGVGTNLEVIQAESDLKLAKTNYNAAMYDALVAKMNLKAALGTLYNE